MPPRVKSANSARTPASKAASLKKKTDKARRKYKINITKRKKFTYEGEQELVKNMIVVLKLANYTNEQTAMIVGVSRNQVAEFLKDGNVQKQYMRLKQQLPQAALELGQAYLIEAVQAVVHVLRTADDDAIILKAAGEIFDRFGIPKSSRVETTPPKGEDDNPISGDPSLIDRIRGAAPETQEAVAQLQEAFEQGIAQLLEKETGDDETSGPPASSYRRDSIRWRTHGYFTFDDTWRFLRSDQKELPKLQAYFLAYQTFACFNQDRLQQDAQPVSE